MLIFCMNTYREVIQHHIDANATLKGYKTNLSKAAQFHLSYLSQILNGSAELTLDQAANLCVFWGFNGEEAEYFLSMVALARSTSESWTQILTKKIESIRARRAIQTWGDFINSELSLLNTMKLSSNWGYGAVWCALDIEHLEGNVEKISAFLKLSKADVGQILLDLQKMGITLFEDGVWKGRPGQSITLYANREISKIMIQTHMNKYLGEFDNLGNHDRTLLQPVSEETLRKVEVIAKDAYHKIHATLANCTQKKDRLVAYHYNLYKI